MCGTVRAASPEETRLGLEVLRDPLTLSRRLEQNVHARPTPEHGPQALARRRDPAVVDFISIYHDPRLAFPLMKVEGHTPWLVFSLRLTSAFQQPRAQATTSLRRSAASSYLRDSGTKAYIRPSWICLSAGTISNWEVRRKTVVAQISKALEN